MSRSLIAIALFAVCCAAMAQPGLIDVPMDPAWGAVPGWTPADKADEYSGVYGDGYATFRASGGGRVMVWAKNPDPRLDVSKMRFVTIRYRATNIDPSLGSYLLYLDTGDSGGMYARNLIFGAGDLTHDGEWHTNTTTLYPFGEIGTLALRFRALEGTEGCLDVAYLRFSEQPPRKSLGEHIDWQPGGEIGQACFVDLSAQMDTKLPDLQKALDVDDWFTGQQVTAHGIPFSVQVDGNVALSTPGEPREPVSIPVEGSGRALYMLMGAKFPYQMLNYDGWAPGDMTDRPEQFRVRVRYADETEDEHVPYNVGSGKYGVWRGLRVYGIPLRDDSEVHEVQICDGMRTSSFYLMALTVSPQSVVPELPDAAVITPLGDARTDLAPGLELDANRLHIQTKTGGLTLELGPQGISLLEADNAGQPGSGLRAQKGSIFSVGENRTEWSGDTFKLAGEPVVAQGRAECRFVSDEAKAELRLVIEPRGSEAVFRCSLKNLAAEARRLNLTFPKVGLSTDPLENLWYFYPSICPAWSNAPTILETSYSGRFPVQFMDLYDRANGGGLYLGTRDRTLKQRYYRMVKGVAGIDASIIYKDNPPLPPGEFIEYPETVIALHSGDWRPAFTAYTDWFKSWYEPARPRIDWYQDVWNFRTYWTHTMGNGNPEHNFFNKETGKFQTEHFIEKDTGQFGQVDMGHFFDWRISEEFGRFGDYSHYDDIGGLDAFRAMIDKFHENDIRVGLYLDCYLASEKSQIIRETGTDWVLKKQGGEFGDGYSTEEDPMYNMCVLQPGWQDHLARACAQAVEQTGCDGVYLDEGMTDYSPYWCWREGHGHPVPGVNQPGLLDLAKKTKAALPEDKALYTEWSPPDVFIPHVDGAYQASLRWSDIHLSPGFVQLHRFAFPDFKVFTISNGGSMYDGIWEGTKFNLFSGVALYTLSWGHDEEVLPLIRKMSAILHEQSEAFRTSEPRPYIQTLRNNVYCNEFPGQTRTVWTLWNGRYHTIRGGVLKVKHVAGSRYVDLWNETELEPRIEDGMAVIETTLGPRGIGAIVQMR